MAYKTETQDLKVSLPTEKREMAQMADAGAIKLQVQSSGPSHISAFLPLLRRGERCFSIPERLRPLPPLWKERGKRRRNSVLLLGVTAHTSHLATQYG